MSQGQPLDNLLLNSVLSQDSSDSSARSTVVHVPDLMSFSLIWTQDARLICVPAAARIYVEDSGPTLANLLVANTS